MGAIYAGYTLRAAEGWDKLVSEPKAPSNWKDSVKIANYIVEAKKKQAEEAADRVLTGEIDKIAIYQGGDVIDVEPGAFFSFFPHHDTLVCVKPLHLLRMLVAYSVTEFGALPKDARWAVRSETSALPLLLRKDEKDVRIIDPIRALVCSTAADNTDPQAFLTRFNLGAISGEVGSAGWLAALARAGAELLGE